MNIHDVQDGDVNAVTASGSGTGITYTVTGTVDASTAGDYFITYTAVDSVSNAATDIVRKVTVSAAVDIGVGNFTMLDSIGAGAGGTNDVTYVWPGQQFNDPSGFVDTDGYTVPSDQTSVMTISSPEPFKGFTNTGCETKLFKSL